MDEDDQDFIDRALRGDISAFMSLMKKHEHLAFAIAYGILRNREDASEAVQQAVVTSFQKLGSLADRSKFKAWFSQIVRNASLTKLRARDEKTVSLDAPDSGASEIPDKAASPRHDLETKELLEKVRNVMAKLTHDHAEVLSLFYFSEKSYSEMAELLGVAIGTISTRMSRGKEEMLRFWKMAR